MDYICEDAITIEQLTPETQAAFKELFTAIEKQYGPIEYITMCRSFEDTPAFKRLAGVTQHKRRSSRALAVQRKRKALGLDPWGHSALTMPRTLPTAHAPLP